MVARRSKGGCSVRASRKVVDDHQLRALGNTDGCNGWNGPGWSTVELGSAVTVTDTRLASQPVVGRWARLRGPVIAGACVVAATVYVATFDPNAGGHYPGCPLKILTGLDCPACGGLRATFALTRGDLAVALDQNIMAVFVLPLLVVWWLVIIKQRWSGRQRIVTPESAARRRALIWTIVAISLVFTVVRNLPLVPYLGSGIG